MRARKSSKDRREQILREATALFTSKGYDGTSIRLIAGMCGISEAAIYRHFDGKESLYRSVITEKAREHDIKGNLDAFLTDATIEEVLTHIATHILSLAEKDPQLVKLMFRNSFMGGSVARELFMEIRLPYIEFLAERIRQGQAKGELVEVDGFISARCFVGMVMDCALNTDVWSSLTNVPFDSNKVICNNVPIFARGLTKVPSS